VTQRATDREIFSYDRIDRDGVVAVVRRAIDRYDIELLDYCVMTNHLHLLLRAPKGNLPRAMQYLGARMVERFNRRHLRRGHLVQAPYHAEPVVTESHSLWVRAYIALNPVQAGLCARPEEWMWSGYGGRGLLAPLPDRATRDLVESALRAGLPRKPPA